MDLSVNHKSCILTLLFMMSLVGCDNSPEKVKVAQKSREANVKILKLEERQSGYSAEPTHWTLFMNCWQNSIRQQHKQVGQKNSSSIDLSILGNHEFQTSDNNQSAEVMALSITKLEKDLRVTLPKSYKDFLAAYRPPYLLPRVMPWGRSLIGFLSLSQVGYLAILQPETLQILEENSIDSDDHSYFVYGIKQDDVARRTRYLRNAILIGFHGDGLHELILLYPDVKTADGEMEAAMLFHSGEFRAPSFAELMRQLSLSETRDVDGEGIPYPQSMLKKTCADKLPMSNIWWE